ncbi:MAG TPA: SDR family NAD(P)-dependent oxidoreductase [Rhodanobacteraceae bacterium]
MTTPTHAPVAIVGTGPGLGGALAARFAAEGFPLALLSRHADSRQPVLDALAAAGHTACGHDCDAGDPASVAAAFAGIRARQGAPGVLIYNAGAFLRGGILELDLADFEAAWRINCYGALLAAREVLPTMLAAGAGTLLFTGATAALRGGAGFAGLAVGKFGLRALAQSLAREFGPRGIHVAHVIIDGQIDSPRTRARDPGHAVTEFLDPAAIAESYWHLHRQPRSAWTQELDLRPSSEHF